MAIDIKITSDRKQTGVKILAYGDSGAGKTFAIKDLPKPLIISAEAGLLSLQKYNLPYVEVKEISDIGEAFKFLQSSKDFESVAIDSISEIADVILQKAKQMNKDQRIAYGQMQDQMKEIIRSFRDLNLNVYITAQSERLTDASGTTIYFPSAPGNKLGQALPFFFDEVLAFRTKNNEEGETSYSILCKTDGTWYAKDRSCALDMYERPNIAAIINKINSISKE